MLDKKKKSITLEYFFVDFFSLFIFHIRNSINDAKLTKEILFIWCLYSRRWIWCFIQHATCQKEYSDNRSFSAYWEITTLHFVNGTVVNLIFLNSHTK